MTEMREIPLCGTSLGTRVAQVCGTLSGEIKARSDGQAGVTWSPGKRFQRVPAEGAAGQDTTRGMAVPLKSAGGFPTVVLSQTGAQEKLVTSESS